MKQFKNVLKEQIEKSIYNSDEIAEKELNSRAFEIHSDDVLK